MYRTRISLTDTYKDKLDSISSELGMTPRETIQFLIDLFYLEESIHLRTFRTSLIRRTRKGVGYNWAANLYVLQLLIGSILKKIGYTK
jgi:hypothetical protein